MAKAPRTASSDHSIWFHLPEDRFREHLVSLEERTNAVPMDPEVFDVEDWQPCLQVAATTLHTLPIEVEQQLADDFARLVAVEEGAQSVAAVCVEEHRDPPRLRLQFAALDISLGRGSVQTALQRISDVLIRVSRSDKESTWTEFVDELFQCIIRLHFFRLLARLRSAKWEKPKYLSRSHKKPLWQDFGNLLHRAGFLYTKREKILRQQVETRIASMAAVYQNFDDVSLEDQLPALLVLVDKSFEFCSVDDIEDFHSRLKNSASNIPTPQIGSAMKCLRQVQKIAGYRRMASHFVDTAMNYPHLFQHSLTIEYLTPYKSVPTAIGYESWATSCHVHAEIQLAVHYDLSLQDDTIDVFLRPRCIGISKWLCFLCYRFLQAHGCFFPSKTHGRLYDQWTIPDLAEFELRIVEQYRGILKKVDDGIMRQTQEEPELYRVEPMTSLD